MILLTGITGKTGSVAARALAGKVPLRAITRNEARAAEIKAMGIEPVIGDANDPAFVAKAAAGASKALLVLNNSAKQATIEKNFIDATKAAGVKHIVKMSSTEAVPGTKNSIPAGHVAVEEHLKASGLTWTLIKPNFYMQNLLGSARTIKANGTFAMPCGNGTTAMIDARDVGAAVAVVLSGSGHENQTYELTGPEVLTFTQAADKFSAALGKPVTYVDQPMAEYKAMLGKFLTDQWHLNAVCELFQEIAEGGLNRTTDTFRKLTGRPPISLAQFIQEHIAAYK